MVIDLNALLNIITRVFRNLQISSVKQPSLAPIVGCFLDLLWNFEDIKNVFISFVYNLIEPQKHCTSGLEPVPL